MTYDEAKVTKMNMMVLRVLASPLVLEAKTLSTEITVDELQAYLEGNFNLDQPNTKFRKSLIVLAMKIAVNEGIVILQDQRYLVTLRGKDVGYQVEQISRSAEPNDRMWKVLPHPTKDISPKATSAPWGDGSCFAKERGLGARPPIFTLN